MRPRYFWASARAAVSCLLVLRLIRQQPKAHSAKPKPLAACRAEQPPSPEAMLYLNGEGTGVVNNVCFPSTVSSSYAPAGKVNMILSTPTHPCTTVSHDALLRPRWQERANQ